MSKFSNQLFENLRQRYALAVERNFKKRLKQAKDKQFVFSELQQNIDNSLDVKNADRANRILLETFDEHYKRGENIETILTEIKDKFSQGPSIKSFNREPNGEITLVSQEELEKDLANFAKNDRQLIRLFIQYLALVEMKKRLPELYKEFWDKEEQPQTKPPLSYDINWTGDNKNEFVQLIYALHEAGLLNSGKGEITKTIVALAKVFNINLGKNWQSNHSNSIHRQNTDYEPPIFKMLEESYKNYTANLIELKKTKQKF